MIWDLIQRIFAGCVLFLLSPILLIFFIAVWLEDRHFPLYVPLRVGKDGILFRMLKLRTMFYKADRINIVATAENDSRITKIGKIARKYKIDEFFQLLNVLKGDILLIGPRPQLISEYKSFTNAEKHIVDVKPGISDFSSLFLSKMEILLSKHENPYTAYFTLCRPIKSRLALFYVKHRSVWVDIQLLFYNFTNFISHRWTMKHMANMIVKLGDCGVPYEVLFGEKEPYPMELP